MTSGAASKRASRAPDGGDRSSRIDATAFYCRHRGMVLRRCRQLLRDEEDARDAVHDTFVNLLRHQHRLDDSSPASLLYRIATNVCLNHLRAARRRPEVAAGESPDDLVGEVSSAEAMAEARGTLSRLFDVQPESTAAMAVLYFQDGHSFREVAAAVGVSTSAVRRRLVSLRDRLRPGLQPHLAA
jgi:RNA polymerase sigma-70 factor (ECF subfamily)